MKSKLLSSSPKCKNSPSVLFHDFNEEIATMVVSGTLSLNLLLLNDKTASNEDEESNNDKDYSSFRVAAGWGDWTKYASLKMNSITVRSGETEEVFIEIPASSVCDGKFKGSLTPLVSTDAEITLDITIQNSSVNCDTLLPKVRLMQGGTSGNLGNQVEGKKIEIPLRVKNEGVVTLSKFEFKSSVGTVEQALPSSFRLESGITEEFKLLLSGIGRNVRSIDITATAFDSGGKLSSSDSANFQVTVVEDTGSKLREIKLQIQSILNKMEANTNLTEKETKDLEGLITALQTQIDMGLEKFADGDYTGANSIYVSANSEKQTVQASFDEYNVPDGPPLTLVIILVLVILVVIGFVVYLSLVPEEEEFT